MDAHLLCFHERRRVVLHPSHLFRRHETRVVDTLDERRHMISSCLYYVLTKGDACCVPISPLSRGKETRVVLARHLYLYERRRALYTRVSSVSTKGDKCCGCVSPLYRQKETRAVDACLLCLDERRNLGCF
jgi:hypothetical protein